VLLGGLFFGGVGVAISAVAAHRSSVNAQMICWIIAIRFIAWGTLLVSRCALSARSRLARFMDRHLPDGAGEDGVALVFAIYLPAALLTLLLRLLGVRGQRTTDTALGRRTQTARPGGLPRAPMGFTLMAISAVPTCAADVRCWGSTGSRQLRKQGPLSTRNRRQALKRFMNASSRLLGQASLAGFACHQSASSCAKR
jgi:hypothetical protein